MLKQMGSHVSAKSTAKHVGMPRMIDHYLSDLPSMQAGEDLDTAP
jgi:hypothetical protein